MNKSKEYGKYLQEIREKKGISLKQAHNDTKIATNIIMALESMEKGIFPSETYRIGLLKLYAKYLSIDESTIMDMIKNNDLQETPIEFELINLETDKKKKKKKIFRYFLLLLVAVGIALFFVFGANKILVGMIVEFRNKRAQEQVEYLADLERIEGFYEANFDLHKKLLLISAGTEAVLEIISISPSQITIDDKVLDLEINVPRTIMLEGHSSPDYILLMRSVNTLKKQLQLRFDPQVERIGNPVPEDLPVDNQDVKVDGNIIDILSAPAMVPIQVALNFTNSSYYKVTTDTAVIKESNANAGFRDVISTDEPIQVYASNSSFINISINDNNVAIPQDGLPFVFRVAWTKNIDSYVLQLIPLP